MITARDWQDYRLLDSGDGEKLESWSGHLLIRPDPQVIWPKSRPELWKKAEAKYFRSKSGGGEWETFSALPKSWQTEWHGLSMTTKLMGFKHTGVFPEQAVNWAWMQERIRAFRGRFRVLNLFGYTGGATLACAKSGAEVVHVDASKGMVAVCKENAAASGLKDAPIRYLVDDAFAFVAREIRRGNDYQGIIMDPPSYGRGPGGQLWKLEDSIYDLVQSCAKLLTNRSDFFLLNSYTTGLQPAVMANVLKLAIPFKGKVWADEIGLAQDKSQLVLPCGCTARWMA